MSSTEAAFSGSVPENYEKYLVPLIFEDYADDLVSRLNVPEGGAVLETACGTGVVTRRMRSALPDSVRLVATDFNPGMLAIARGVLGEGSSIEFEESDATALKYDDNTFDAVVCQFGVMFFPDRDLGYREAARVLKPGGSFLFSVWDSLDHNRLPQLGHETAMKMLPEDPPQFLAMPFSYHDLSEIKAQLQGAGFGDIDIAVMPRESTAPSAREVALAFTTGTPLAPQLAERGIEGAAREKLEEAVAKEFGAGPVTATMQAITIVAKLAG